MQGDWGFLDYVVILCFLMMTVVMVAAIIIYIMIELDIYRDDLFDND